MWDRGRVGKLLVRVLEVHTIISMKRTGKASMKKAIKEPVCRADALRSHPTNTGRIGHAITLGSVGSVGLDCHSLKIPALGMDVLGGSGTLEALSGLEGEGFMF